MKKQFALITYFGLVDFCFVFTVLQVFDFFRGFPVPMIYLR